MSELSTCWRCGVDFDASDYLPDAPCADCQLDYPGNWLKGGFRTKTNEEKAADIRYYWKQELNDVQIAAKLGIHQQTVASWRSKLGLAPNTWGNQLDSSVLSEMASKRAYRTRFWEYSPRNKPGAHKGKKRSEGRDFN